MIEAFSTAHLDYLQRADAPTAVPDPRSPGSWAPLTHRRLHRITAIGRLDRDRLRDRPPTSKADDSPAPFSRDLLIGLHQHKIPLAFAITGTPAGVNFHLGTWEPVVGSDAPPAPAALHGRQGIVETMLGSLYASVRSEPVSPELAALPYCGLAVGVPTTKSVDPLDPVTAMDRLVRALEGQHWSVLLLAQAVDDAATRFVRDAVTNELRSTKSEADALKAPSPQAERYAKLLEGTVESLFDAEAVGSWRTAVYLLGTSSSYSRLAAVWTGLFNGESSVPEPVRVCSGVHPSAAANWVLHDTPAPAGPGLFRHPFRHQTLLNSTQLAAYVHLPERELTGLSIVSIPGFDAVPHVLDPGATPLGLGTVVSRGNPTEVEYAVDRRALVRHAFVAGVTGAGKTNTVFSLLEQADRAGVPFLVLEPAKTEYRALLTHPAIGSRLQVFSAGAEDIAPLRLNPFEVIGDTPVGVHLDLLRSLFTVSFGMWAPLPQLLEQALHRAYTARGWDVTANRNRRLEAGGDRADAYPTLTDLLVEVERVIGEQGWDDKISGDMRASLVTRINGLRQGGKGRMLDTQRSLPPEVLFERPVVLELEGMGDDDDKAFLMGLLLIRLAEYRRRPEDRNASDLRHLLVIEEAHRLLTNVGRRGGDEQADPRAKAVESFANLLSEVRAYGQGVIVADQVPTKLAPDVIKNTNLKIAHRVVDTEDRQVLAGAMAMDDAQARSLGILRNGEAAVFAEGDDAPVLVKVTQCKHDRAWPTNDEISQHMAATIGSPALADLYRRHPGCRDVDGVACEAARTVVGDDGVFQRTLGRFALALVEADNAPAQFWPLLVARAQERTWPVPADAVLLGCLSERAGWWYASRRGADLGWSFADTELVARRLAAVLEVLADPSSASLGDAVAAYREVMHRLHARIVDPHPTCARTCDQSRVCLYRRDVEEIVRSRALSTRWQRAGSETPDEATGAFSAGWHVATIAAGMLAGRDAPAPVVRRAALCFAQHQLMADAGEYPELASDAMASFLAEGDAWLEWRTTSVEVRRG